MADELSKEERALIERVTDQIVTDENRIAWAYTMAGAKEVVRGTLKRALPLLRAALSPPPPSSEAVAWRVRQAVEAALLAAGFVHPTGLEPDQRDAFAASLHRSLAALYAAPPALAGRGVPEGWVRTLETIRAELGAAITLFKEGGLWTNAAGYTIDAALWLDRAWETATSALPPPPEGGDGATSVRSEADDDGPGMKKND